MPQVFDAAATLTIKLVLLAMMGGIVLLSVALLWRNDAPVEAGVAVEQPIPFSHKHHVGDIGLDCRYCHTSVETSRSAGMPSSGTCMTCHAQLFTQAPALEPLHASVRNGQPIAWKRVHDLPDFVYFDHSIHVNKGVACVTCHGRVDRMPIMLRQQALNMEWCLDCHRAPQQRIGPREDVFKMQDVPVPSMRDVEQLRRIFDLDTSARMTDCSTCHR